MSSSNYNNNQLSPGTFHLRLSTVDEEYGNNNPTTMGKKKTFTKRQGRRCLPLINNNSRSSPVYSDPSTIIKRGGEI